MMGNESERLLDEPVGGARLVDHPSYRAPKLKSTWCQMLPRMAAGCACLLVILVAMISVVWSVVSSAPGDPLHTSAKHNKGGLSSAASSASNTTGSSPFDWIMGVVKSRPDNR